MLQGSYVLLGLGVEISNRHRFLNFPDPFGQKMLCSNCMLIVFKGRLDNYLTTMGELGKFFLSPVGENWIVWHLKFFLAAELINYFYW